MTNPLALRDGGEGGGMSRDDLEAYAAKLNGMNFSKALGWHWRVKNRELPDGTRQHVLDRAEGPQGPRLNLTAEDAAELRRIGAQMAQSFPSARQ